MFLTKCMYVVVVLGLLLSLSVVRAAAIPMLSVDPPTKTVQPGQHFSLDIRIADVTEPTLSSPCLSH